MELVFKRPECLVDVPFHFCPGCHHGVAHRLVAEAIDYFKIREKTIGVASVGCSVFMYDYLISMSWRHLTEGPLQLLPE